LGFRQEVTNICQSSKKKEEVITEDEQRGKNLGSEAVVKSKFFSHFIKGKISLIPMETILIILRELEYLEGLVKLARRRKDVEGHRNQVAAIHSTHVI
jgi:hypothetical protein